MPCLAADFREGPGDLILFIHGLGCARESFARAFTEKGLEGYALLVPDLTGHGESSPGAAALEDHVAALEGLLSDHSFDRLHIVGHSMGGAVGVLLAGQETVAGRLASFVNVEGNLAAPDCGLVSRRAAATDKARYVARGHQARVTLARESHEASVRLWGAWMDRADPASFHESADSLVAWTESGRLLDAFRALTCTKVYVFGEDSAPSGVLDLVGDLPSQGFVDAGHFVMIDTPRRFYAWLVNWLASVPG